MPENQLRSAPLASVRSLTQEERQLAYSAAADAVMRDIGERPQREHFNHYAPTVIRSV